MRLVIRDRQVNYLRMAANCCGSADESRVPLRHVFFKILDGQSAEVVGTQGHVLFWGKVELAEFEWGDTDEGFPYYMLLDPKPFTSMARTIDFIQLATNGDGEHLHASISGGRSKRDLLVKFSRLTKLAGKDTWFPEGCYPKYQPILDKGTFKGKLNRVGFNPFLLTKLLNKVGFYNSKGEWIEGQMALTFNKQDQIMKVEVNGYPDVEIRLMPMRL